MNLNYRSCRTSIPRKRRGKHTHTHEVETVNEFCYLGDRLNAGGGCEAAVTARVRIGWVRFRESGELLLGNTCRFCLKMKGKFIVVA